MTTLSQGAPVIERSPARPAIAARRSPLGRIVQMFAVRRQRAKLARLDDWMLRDIGISRADATREATRPIWDAPAHWSR